MFEKYQGIYVEPKALAMVMNENSAITLKGESIENLKAELSTPSRPETFDSLQQDGITIYLPKDLDRKDYHINVARKSWWKPGKLEVVLDRQDYPLPRL